jgi:hypothetical protein
MQVVSDRADALARAAAGELLAPMDIAALFRIGPSRFYALNNLGRFDFLKVKPAIGPRCFSGTKVYRYLQGESVEAPVFSRKAQRAS